MVDAIGRGAAVVWFIEVKGMGALGRENAT